MEAERFSAETDVDLPGLLIEANPPKAEVVDALLREARELERAVRLTEKGHFEAHSVLSAIHVSLGSAAALSGAVAGGGALLGTSSGNVVSAISGAAAAITSALLTFAKPQEMADKHQTVGTRYNALRGRIRRFETIAIYATPASGLQKDIEALERLATQKAELDNTGPGVPDYAFKRVQRKVKKARPA
jgi:hypothetical protein